MKCLKILIAAYACRPDKGSEPGVGWNMARELSKYHEVWVLTRVNNQAAIEAELHKNPLSTLHVVYGDLPGPLRWWRQEHWEIHLHYYLWQLGSLFKARELHHEVGFDLVHHVTYGRYCDPSFLAFLSVPFVWGPIGGGESAPLTFWKDFGFKGRLYETIRNITRWLGEKGPLTRATAHRSAVAIAATQETADRLKKMGVGSIKMISGQTGINQQELSEFQTLGISHAADRPVRFLSLGRLLHWKGFHLGLQAFAQAKLTGCEYWVIGDGPERQRLQDLAKDLGIEGSVNFLGNLPRDKALAALSECDVLIHPSLHDFSPTVCLESMAAARPVICLNLGGPAGQVTQETGIRVSAVNPAQTVDEIADAMMLLVSNPQLRVSLGQAGQQRVSNFYSWDYKGKFITQLYEEILQQSA